jgi:hypothetical protein
MKRASLISVVLTVALAIACSTPTNNINKNTGYIPPGTANPGLLTIAVVVAQDPLQTDPTVEVTDPSYAAAPQKIRWCVYNDTQTLVTDLAIVFAGTPPCDNSPTLTLSNIEAGNDPAACTAVACDCSSTAANFAYVVNVTTATGQHAQDPNPRVILN